MILKICNASFIFIKCPEKSLRLTSLIFKVGNPKFLYRQLILKYKKFKPKNIKITEPSFIDIFRMNKMEINGNLKISIKEGGKKLCLKKYLV